MSQGWVLNGDEACCDESSHASCMPDRDEEERWRRERSSGRKEKRKRLGSIATLSTTGLIQIEESRRGEVDRIGLCVCAVEEACGRADERIGT